MTMLVQEKGTIYFYFSRQKVNQLEYAWLIRLPVRHQDLLLFMR